MSHSFALYSRRQILKRGFLTLTTLMALPQLPTPSQILQDWNPGTEIYLSTDRPFDLATTLPTGTQTGGIFSVHSSGTQLPEGVHLSSDGKLTLQKDSQLELIDLRGVLLTYEVS